MNFNSEILQKTEQIVFSLRALYQENGYQQYRMSKFEEYDLYAGHKDFLVSDRVVTFTDPNGKLMALRPDVTLSIIKNLKDSCGGVQKLCYNENVYRVDAGSQAFRETMQSGVECIGELTAKEFAQVVLLAAASLSLLSEDFVLNISDLSLLSALVTKATHGVDSATALYTAIDEKNLGAIRGICAKEGTESVGEQIVALLVNPTGDESALLSEVLSVIKGNPLASFIKVDYSVVQDTGYYNGLVFKGFVNKIPQEVLSGGMYAPLLARLRKPGNGIGFAVFVDRFDRYEETAPQSGDDFVNIALPKGRLGEKVYGYFERAGFECASVMDPGRKLIFENTEKKIRFFWVKPSDVAIYVERGAADIGVAGKDILLEYEPKVYELLDLQTGKCRMAVAGKKGFLPPKEGTLRVATKFANIAKKYYTSLGQDIDIIHLNGSIELAPILGLSDVIVDIVETGSTLRENGLEVVETIVDLSARLIANKASYRFKQELIDKIMAGLAKAKEE